MSRTKGVYTERLTVKITRHMLADLDNVAGKSGEPVSAIVRQAIRNYLDGTDLTLGTRRTFDRRFQTRMAEMEKNVKRHLDEGLERIRADLSKSVEQDWRRVEHLMQRDLDQAVSRMTLQVKQALAERDEQKRGWRR